MQGHIEMIRTKPDEVFKIPEGGKLVHVDHEDAGLYVYFFVPHETMPPPAPTKGTGWRA